MIVGLKVCRPSFSKIYLPDGVVDAADRLAHAEQFLRDLRGHDIAIVALGHRDEDVGLADAGLLLDLLFGGVTDDDVSGE